MAKKETKKKIVKAKKETSDESVFVMDVKINGEVLRFKSDNVEDLKSGLVETLSSRVYTNCFVTVNGKPILVTIPRAKLLKRSPLAVNALFRKLIK